MGNKARRIIIGIALMLITMFVLAIYLGSGDLTGKDSMEYFIDNFHADTGASNGVTAIYLNYRAFDTFFEALLLMISVSGIIYFLKEKGRDNGE